jgi:peptidoglycan lytic transglycosylase G
MKRLLKFLLIVLILGALALAGWLATGVTRPFKGYAAGEQFVDIEPGSSRATIGRKLAEAGVVRSELAFRIAVWMRAAGPRLQAGEYRFDRPMTALDVVDKIRRGDVFLQPITFPEGLTIRQMSTIFESRGFGGAREFVSAAKHAELIADLDPDARDLEGYLFPETYTLKRNATAEQLVARMVASFKRVLTPELRQQADRRGFSVRQLVTLASLVEKETARPDERPLVAAVYRNRLRGGIALYCDPTVIYALERANRYTGNLTKEDLRFDSPYNTYVYAGLPPGPIAAPGRASLEAAANPADVPYLYFVSRNDGSHVFSTTLDEHNRNVAAFQKQPRRP